MTPASPATSVDAMSRRGWAIGIAVALAVALASLLSNITTEAQMMGQADTVKAVRLTISKLLNSGTVWAGLPILTGWLVRKRGQAAAIGIVSCLVALVGHYALGQAIGIFEPAIWQDNAMWFAFAAVLGAPLGLIGSVARHETTSGLLARLVVPAGALLEPFVVGMFTEPAILPWPVRVASAACGVALLACGAIGAALVVRRYVLAPHNDDGASAQPSSTARSSSTVSTR